jgi:hypothetical protein
MAYLGETGSEGHGEEEGQGGALERGRKGWELRKARELRSLDVEPGPSTAGGAGDAGGAVRSTEERQASVIEVCEEDRNGGNMGLRLSPRRRRCCPKDLCGLSSSFSQASFRGDRHPQFHRWTRDAALRAGMARKEAERGTGGVERRRIGHYEEEKDATCMHFPDNPFYQSKSGRG